MPQPKQTPAQPVAPPAESAVVNNGADSIDMSQMVNGLLTQADGLKGEKDALFSRIGANRDMLRNLVKTGAASDEQVKRIDTLYPPRERKAKDTAAPAADTNTTPAAS